ncbi:hypothetical protein E2320_008183 [Naja naja]|nr:hypothetical protein E2320_008183 [Naja naja]
MCRLIQQIKYRSLWIFEDREGEGEVTNYGHFELCFCVCRGLFLVHKRVNSLTANLGCRCLSKTNKIRGQFLSVVFLDLKNVLFSQAVTPRGNSIYGIQQKDGQIQLWIMFAISFGKDPLLIPFNLEEEKTDMELGKHSKTVFPYFGQFRSNVLKKGIKDLKILYDIFSLPEYEKKLHSYSQNERMLKHKIKMMLGLSCSAVCLFMKCDLIYLAWIIGADTNKLFFKSMIPPPLNLCERRKNVQQPEILLSNKHLLWNLSL